MSHFPSNQPQDPQRLDTAARLQGQHVESQSMDSPTHDRQAAIDSQAQSSVGVEVRNVSRSFAVNGTNVSVLHDISLSIDPGEFVSIIGPSGVGKTTLLRLIAGVDALQEGTINFFDQRGVRLDSDQVVYHPQRDALLEWQRVINNATLGARLGGTPRVVAQAAAIKMLEEWGLGEVISSWPHTLSGGMRQRVAMVRSLLTPRAVLALDEPFGALDALTRQSMQKWLQRLRVEDRRTAFMVTHDLDEALAVSSRIVVLTGRPGVISHIEALPQQEIEDEYGEQHVVSAFASMTLSERLDLSDYRAARKRLTDSLAGTRVGI